MLYSKPVAYAVIGGAVLLSLAVSCIADEPEKCLKPESEPVEVATGKVLCCCVTYSGGTCCNYVSYCGSIVPGCICSMKADAN